MKNYTQDNNAAEETVRLYSDMLYKIAIANTRSAADAEDIVQEALFRYLKYNPDFETEDHKKAWLIRVTVNLSRSLLKSAWFRKTTALDDRYFTEMEELNEVHRQVLQLPVKYRIPIHLFYYEGYSIREISGILEKKEATVKTLLRRGRIKLKERLQGEYDDL